MMSARILVAEDEALIAEELRDRLTQMGHIVLDVLSTGEEMVEYSLAENPDLILMDIRLKGRMDGVEAASRIRNQLDVPILYLTAHSDDATLQRAKITSPMGYLIKPIGEREFQVALEIALHKAGLERKLRESQELFSATLTSISDAVIATDALGRILFMNPVAEWLTGCRMNESVGLLADQIYCVFDAVTGQAVPSLIGQVLSEKRAVTHHRSMRLRAANHTEMPIEASAAPIRRFRGDPIYGVVVVFRDISEKERATEAVRKAEEQLRQSEKLEAVGRLAGGVAHDLNNMMTIVTGFGDILLHQIPQDDPIREMVEQIKRAGDRAAAMTRELLAFGQKQLLMPVGLQLNEILENLASRLRVMLSVRIAVRTELSPDLGLVLADPAQFEQAIVQLAINARDAMPEGGALTLRTRNRTLYVDDVQSAPEMAPGEYVEVSLSDTGVGMDLATQARIFEPFFTTKEFGQGSGLGLASVFGMIRQSRGHVFVASAPNQGSTFQIMLPRYEPPHAEDGTVGKWPRGSETILLVTCDDRERQLARRLLEQQGYQVIEASDSSEALAISDRIAEPIHLLLSDGVMPGIDGQALADRLLARRSGLRILFLAKAAEILILRRQVTLSMCDYVQRPFTAGTLFAKVRAILDRAGSVH